MRKSLVGAGLAMSVWACWAGPVAPSGAAASALPVTSITVNRTGGDRVYDGVGAVLGGGGNARYLMDYPQPERSQIFDYLFKPGYGASLQLLKLEIGGGANSTDGSEPSIQPTSGQINCNAGYEFSIARQAVALNPYLKLYGLQWAAPGWVSDGTGSVFTSDDIRYLINWLGCAKRRGLTITYLGGWNESDNGTHASWFHSLRTALNATGYAAVRLIAADSSPDWHYISNPPNPDIAFLGSHDVCGFPTGIAGPRTACIAPPAAVASGKPLWASELGAMDAGAQSGCTVPCAPAMDRATVRGYIDARLTGYLEWPVIDAMPPGLPYENRGLITADQPWSGHYSVNAMTWAIAQFTQFAWPPWSGHTRGWKYVDSASGFLQGHRADGSYVTLVRSGGGWSVIIETTSAAAAQRASFTITGGTSSTSGRVHVWASDFNPAAGRPSTWFDQLPDIRPVLGKFTITLRPGWVYSLTTSTGQGHGTAAGPAAANFPLPYRDSLATSGQAGRSDDEPQYLAAQDGSFELERCQAPGRMPGRSNTTCTEQEAVRKPVFWPANTGARSHYPYAIIGDASWANYVVSIDTLLTRPGTSAGLIGRFSNRGGSSSRIGQFDGYLFDVAATGAWKLIKDDVNASKMQILASATLAQPLYPGTWHRLSLSMSGSTIMASVDGHQVTSVSDSSWASGPAGIEAGAFTGSWPQAQYSNLSVTR
jgi:hypothetical protein